MADGSTTNADSVTNINDAQLTWQEQLANVQNILRNERERHLCEARENQARSTCDGGELREGENDQSHDRQDREKLSQRLAQLVKARQQARRREKPIARLVRELATSLCLAKLNTTTSKVDKHKVERLLETLEECHRERTAEITGFMQGES